MENGLGQMVKVFIKGQEDKVLILLLMENGLGLAHP